MAFTSGEKYIEAVQNPRIAFSDNDLKYCQVESVLILGSPMPKPYSGGFTTTFRLSNNNNSWAARCFTREVHDLQQRYQVIGKFFSLNNSKYFVEAKYLSNGININGTQYPIIKMHWLDGELLNTYLNGIFNQKSKIENLMNEFVNLIKELEGYGIAHGDLQHGNIIVKNDKLFLIDYDGMFFPELTSVKTNEIGHPNFQHPERSLAHFNNRIDRFSAITIYLALKAISLKPDLWNIYNNSDNILFKSKDFQNPQQSSLICQLLTIPELKTSTEKFIGVCNLGFNSIPSLTDYLSGNFNYSLSSKATQSFSSTHGSSANSRTFNESELFNNLYKNKHVSPPLIVNPVAPSYVQKKQKTRSFAWIWFLGILLVALFFGYKFISSNSAKENTSVSGKASSNIPKTVNIPKAPLKPKAHKPTSTTNNSSSPPEKVNPYGTGNGKLTLYKTCNYCPDLEVRIDGNYVGTITKTLSSASCDEYGTLSKILSIGNHTITGKDSYGITYEKTAYISEGECTIIPFSKSNDIKPNPYGNGNGKITFLKTCNSCPDLKVYVDDRYVGILNQTLSISTSCDDYGTISKILPIGSHSVIGRDSYGTSYSSTVYVYEGQCTTKIFSKSNDVKPNIDEPRNGQVTIYHTCANCSNVKVSIDGRFSGTLTKYYQSGSPECGTQTDGESIVKNLSEGNHSITAKDDFGNTWSGSVNVSESRCKTYALENFTKANPYGNGKGMVSFWTDKKVVYKLSIDGNVQSYILQHFSGGEPVCGQDGTLSIILSEGKHSFMAKVNEDKRYVDDIYYSPTDDEVWKGTFYVIAGQCRSIKVNKRY